MGAACRHGITLAPARRCATPGGHVPARTPHAAACRQSRQRGEGKRGVAGERCPHGHARRKDGKTEGRKDGRTERREDGRTEGREDERTERRRNGKIEKRRGGTTERREDGKIGRRNKHGTAKAERRRRASCTSGATVPSSFRSCEEIGVGVAVGIGVVPGACVRTESRTPRRTFSHSFSAVFVGITGMILLPFGVVCGNRRPQSIRQQKAHSRPVNDTQ
jgi:hypothetical protein